MRYLIAITLICIVGCGSQSIPAASPVMATVFSVEVHPYDALSTSHAALLDMRNNLHVGAIRTDYDPVYDYAWLHDAIAIGLKADIITPYIHIGEQINLPAYAATCAAAAHEFPGQTWELQNEPDSSAALHEQQLTPAEYMDLVRAVAPAIRSADPTATIITDTSGVNYAWLAAIAPVLSLVDAVAIHPYGTPPSRFRETIAKVEAQTNKPVDISEWGEAPWSARDIVTAIDQVRGYTAFFNVYQYRDQPNDSLSYGLLEHGAAYTAYSLNI